MMRDVLQGAGYALVILGLISSRWVHAFADPVMDWLFRNVTGNSILVLGSVMFGASLIAGKIKTAGKKK